MAKIAEIKVCREIKTGGKCFFCSVPASWLMVYYADISHHGLIVKTNIVCYECSKAMVAGKEPDFQKKKNVA